MFQKLFGIVALSISLGMFIVILVPGGIYLLAFSLAILGGYLLFVC